MSLFIILSVCDYFELRLRIGNTLAWLSFHSVFNDLWVGFCGRVGYRTESCLTQSNIHWVMSDGWLTEWLNGERLFYQRIAFQEPIINQSVVCDKFHNQD